jgi:O-antigen ligase
VVPLGLIGSAARAVGLAFACVALWRILLVRRVRPPSPTLLLLTGFTAWAAFSMLWARVTPSAVDRVMSYAQLLLFQWLGWQVVRTRPDWRALAAGYVAGCGVGAVGSWVAGFAGVSYSGAEYDARYAAFDPNEQGVTLAIAIPLAVHLGTTAKGVWRATWLSFVPVAISATVLTGSRGASITTLVALFAALYVARGSERRFVVPLGGLVLAGLVAAAVWVPSATWERILTVGAEISGGSLSDRVSIWRAGLTVFAGHPIIGVGVAGFSHAVVPALGREVVAHNTPLSVAAELGVVGLSLFLGAFVAATVASRGERTAHALVRALFATWLVGAASLSWEYRKTTWLVLLLAATAAALDDAPVADEELTVPAG